MTNTPSIRRLNQRIVAARLVSALIVALGFQCSRAALLFYDPFDYPPGEELGEAASNEKWTNDKNQFTIVTGSLNYPGLKPSAGNRVNSQSTAPSLDSVRTLDQSWVKQSSGTLYVSFILRLHSFAQIVGTGQGAPLIVVGDTVSDSQLLGINLINDGRMRLGVLKYPSSSKSISSSAFFTTGLGANLSVDGSTTYLVVAKYEWVEGANNDVVTLWVNPTSLGGREDQGNKVQTSSGADGDGSAGRLTLCRGANVNVDEVRIGQTWADVTPTLEPPRHWAVMVGVLACGLVIAGLWITHLRQKVKERSAALQSQTLERQRAEQQRLMEQERSRIAHDLHDELGADIAEISMLATRAQDAAGAVGDEHCLSQMVGKSRQMVAKLEEIVWAMNPEHDSLGDLVSYFSFFADRFLSLANIKLTMDTAEASANLALDARVRHQLFLGFKEALTNVVKHSGANEVRLLVRVTDTILRVEVSDNGVGFRTCDALSGAHEGIANMRRRMDKLGGQFEVSAVPGQGTTVKFLVALSS